MSNGLRIGRVLFFLICIDLIIFSTSVNIYTLSDAQIVHAKLFIESGYNKLFRPSSIVFVDVGYNLLTVNSLDIKSQILTTTGFFTLIWKDDRLRWNASVINIDFIAVPQDLVWHPDLIVLNLIQELEKNLGADNPVQIDNNGTIVWKQMAVLSTLCFADVFLFPFDRHACKLQLSTFNLRSSTVLLNFLETKVYEGTQHSQGDWRIVTTEHHDWLKTGGEWNDVLNFIIKVQRYPGHYIMIIIVPTVLIVVLTFVTFYLPLKSGIRIGYILTVVLAMVVLLTLFADTMPTSSRYPSILVLLITVALGMALLLIIITVFVMSLYNKPKHCKAPNWMHSLVRKSRKLKLKFKCRATRIKHLEQNQAVEGDRPTEDKGNVKISTQLKLYSNKELTEFFDFCLFVAYTILYISGIITLLIIAKIWFST